MDAFQITLGKKMELRPQLPDGTFSESVFYSQVQNVVSESEFQIFPLTDNNLESWIGRILQVTVVQESSAYVGVAKTEKIVSEGNLRFFDLILTENFEPKQRRDYYRLKLRVEIEIEGCGKFKTFDISGNGLSFLSDKKFMKDEALAITLHLKDDQFDICGIVVRCTDYSAEKSLVSIYYKDIERKAQNEITRFLHRQQLIMIRKGVL